MVRKGSAGRASAACPLALRDATETGRMRPGSAQTVRLPILSVEIFRTATLRRGLLESVNVALRQIAGHEL